MNTEIECHTFFLRRLIYTKMKKKTCQMKKVRVWSDKIRGFSFFYILLIIIRIVNKPNIERKNNGLS
jgi:hypothetical protein